MKAAAEYELESAQKETLGLVEETNFGLNTGGTIELSNTP